MNRYRRFWMGIALLGAVACEESPTFGVAQVIEIGAIVDLTGDLGDQGAGRLAGLNVGLEDAQVELGPAGVTVDLAWGDGQTSAQSAAVLLNTFLQQDRRVVIGPFSSEQVAAVRDRIMASNSLILSPSSTSLELALPDDHIYRLVPNDSHLVAALVERMLGEGRDKLAIVYRNDAWGRSVSGELATQFTDGGGMVLSTHGYDALRTTIVDDILEEIRSDLESDLAQDPTGVALSLISFAEGSLIFDRARLYQPTLKEIRWYGSDGFVHDSGLTATPALAQFAVDVEYVAPIYRVEVPAEFASVVTRIEQKSGRPATAYDLISYDAIRIAVRTLANVPRGASVADLVAALNSVLADYRGVSGTVALDVAGDRMDDRYDFFAVRESGGSYSWVRAGS